MNKNYPGISHIKELWQQKSTEDFGWVMYRFPGTDQVHFSAGQVHSGIIGDGLDTSFIAAPFFTENHIYWKIDNTIQSEFQADQGLDELPDLPFYYQPQKSETTSETEYCTAVKNIITAIKNQELVKAVPARIKYVQRDSDFKPFAFFKSLLDSYPNAFVYVLSAKHTGTWIGCTPELLLQAQGNDIKTLSLAGTKKNNGIKNDDSLKQLFSEKELDEQNVVTNYIRNILEKQLVDIKTEGPKLIEAGNVYHLATYFSGILNSSNPSHYGDLVNALHPTPAVCGFPLKESLKILLEQEKFDRSLYSGFLGPVTENKASLYVNLRCMQVFENSFGLYAGAGVVNGSVPENEWLETEEKMNTVLKFL